MVDKAIFPRDKVCGDTIPNLALKVMSEINIKYKEYFYSSRYVSSYCTDAIINWKSISFTDYPHFKSTYSIVSFALLLKMLNDNCIRHYGAQI